MLFDREMMREYLNEVGEELAQQGIRGDLFLVGGGAMALAYNTRRATRDVEGVFEPKRLIYEAAARVAQRHGGEVPEDWLNDGVKGYMLGEDPDATVAFQHAGLTVRVASPRYLFAMKVAASRVEQDDDDIAILFRLSGFTTVDDALDYIEATYPHLRLQPKCQYLLEEIAATQQLEAENPAAASTTEAAGAVETCGKIVKRSGKPCLLTPGHGGRCNSVPR